MSHLWSRVYSPLGLPTRAGPVRGRQRRVPNWHTRGEDLKLRLTPLVLRLTLTQRPQLFLNRHDIAPRLLDALQNLLLQPCGVIPPLTTRCDLLLVDAV